MTLNWVLIVWTTVMSASATLASIHFMAWLASRRAWHHLAYATFAAGTVAMGASEIALMRAQTPLEFATFVRWGNVAAYVLMVSLIAFVLLYMRAGRLWLAWTFIGLRSVCLLVNFTVGQNLNFLEVTRIDSVPFLGETVTVGEGVPNPWMLLAQVGLLILVIFVVDATITVWRRGDRRRAAILGGSIVTCVLLGVVPSVLVLWGHVRWPITISVADMLIVTAIAYEMSRDRVTAARLASELDASNASLKESERRFSAASEAAGVGVWEWQPANDEIWSNDQLRRLFGLPESGPVNVKRLLDSFHPEDRDALRGSIARAVEVGGGYEHEHRIALPDGRVRWIHTRGAFDEAAKVLRGVSIDVTERKAAEDLFRLVVQSAPVGIALLGPDNRIILSNAQLEADFGYSRDELALQSIEVLIPERYRSRHAAKLAKYHAAPSKLRMEGREILGRRKDGSEIPLEIGLNPVALPAGAGVLATVSNLSERRQHEEMLRRERTFLRQIIDMSPNLIFAKNREGRFTLANHMVATVYGTSIENLIGKSDADFNKHPDEVDAFRRADLDVMDRQQELKIPEEMVTDAAGKVHWMQTVKRPIVDEDGKAHQVLGTSTDITERKWAELDLERQRNELAHLTRVTLVSELSGSIAHELSQPLTAILSNAQAALRFMAGGAANLEEVREILQDIVDDDKRAAEIIRGLRTLLKKSEMHNEPLDINGTIKDVLRLVRSDLLNAGVTTATELAEGLPAVIGERVQLQQVLLNLVMNGCDAMSTAAAADRKLAISTRLIDRGSIQVCVDDQGPGIKAEDLERVFEPFYTTKTHGLGLGLAVCRHIIAAHGGRLWAEDRPEGGARFGFTLPVGPGGGA